MANESTTIKLSRSAIESLNKIKIHPRQPYDEVISVLLKSYKKSKIESISKHSGQITTIKVSKDNVSMLSKLKLHPRQSYEEVVIALIKEFKK